MIGYIMSVNKKTVEKVEKLNCERTGHDYEIIHINDMISRSDGDFLGICLCLECKKCGHRCKIFDIEDIIYSWQEKEISNDELKNLISKYKEIYSEREKLFNDSHKKSIKK